MVGPVHDWACEIGEASIHQGKEVVSHLLHAADFSDEKAALGGEESSRFDFQRDSVPESFAQSISSRIPQLKVLIEIHISFVIFVRNRQATTSADGLDGSADRDRRFLHRIADFA